jgi:hypothetical protein
MRPRSREHSGQYQYGSRDRPPGSRQPFFAQRCLARIRAPSLRRLESAPVNLPQNRVNQNQEPGYQCGHNPGWMRVEAKPRKHPSATPAASRNQEKRLRNQILSVTRGPQRSLPIEALEKRRQRLHQTCSEPTSACLPSLLQVQSALTEEARANFKIIAL